MWSVATRRSRAFIAISNCGRSPARRCRWRRRWGGCWRARSSPMSMSRVSTEPVSTASRCVPTIRSRPANARPRPSRCNPEILTPGAEPGFAVMPGTATLIATGGMVPRGADAVIMVEHTETRDADGRTVHRGAPPGRIRSVHRLCRQRSGAWRDRIAPRPGADLARNRHAGGGRHCAAVEVWRRPRVAIISTGDEIIAPGRADPARARSMIRTRRSSPPRSRRRVACRCRWGSAPTTQIVLSRLVDEGLAECDMVILSGGTSKGAGDLCYRAVAHVQRSRHCRPWRGPEAGQAAMPGGDRRQADHHAAGLSDLGDLHLSRIRRAGDPRLCRAAGRAGRAAARRPADAHRLGARPDRISDGVARCTRRRTARSPPIPTPKGSGAVTAFSQADGFITIGPHVERVPAADAGRGAVDRPRPSCRSRHHRQPLRRARRADRPAARPRGSRSRRSMSAAPAGSPPPSAASATSPPIHLMDPADRRIQSAVPDPGLGAGARLSPAARHCLPQGRSALRRPLDRGGDSRRNCRTGLPDGQPQRRQRHPHPDRPPAWRARSRPAIGRSRNRTTRSPSRWRRTAPIGGSRSRASPGNTASASSRRRTSITISSCRRRGSSGRRCGASGHCSTIRR